MKKLLLIITMLVLSNIANSQDQLLDFFNKDEQFLKKYSERVKDQDIDGVVLYTKSFDNVNAFFMYDTKRKRCVAIMIPYQTEKERLILEKSLKVKKIKNNLYYLRTEMDSYLVRAYFDKKSKMLIFD
jgi:hypothetical protein